MIANTYYDNLKDLVSTIALLPRKVVENLDFLDKIYYRNLKISDFPNRRGKRIHINVLFFENKVLKIPGLEGASIKFSGESTTDDVSEFGVDLTYIPPRLISIVALSRGYFLSSPKRQKSNNFCK